MYTINLHLINPSVQDCLHGCIQEIENTFRAARDSLAAHLQQEQKTTPSPGSHLVPSAPASPAGKSSHNNNNSKLMETDNQGSGAASASSTESAAASERSSQTPTEVFSVDWLYVA
jgi:hypothetical protein